MSLYLGKIGRRIVGYSLTSPKMTRAANVAGHVLRAILPHYKIGLTRTAFQAAGSVKAGDVLKINSGTLFRNGEALIHNETLFSQLKTGDFEVTQEMLSPEKMASYFRWDIFYDSAKLRQLGLWSCLSLGLCASIHFNLSASFAMQNLKQRIISFTPLLRLSDIEVGVTNFFHSLSDPAETFVAGQLTGNTLLTLIGLLFVFKTTINYSRDNKANFSRDNNWETLGKLSFVIALGGRAIQTTSLELLNGSWDYFYIGVENNTTISRLMLNLPDIMIYCSSAMLITYIPYLVKKMFFSKSKLV